MKADIGYQMFQCLKSKYFSHHNFQESTQYISTHTSLIYFLNHFLKTLYHSHNSLLCLLFLPIAFKSKILNN